MDTFVGRVLRTCVFPVSVAFALAMPYVVRWTGMPAPMSIFIVFLAAVTLAAVLERFAPREAAWRLRHGRDIWVDGLSLGVLMGAVDPALKNTWPALAASVFVWIGVAHPHAIFPNAWPYLAKIVLATVVAEFGHYWVHRLSHQWLPMWRFHSLHHSAKRIYWLNGFRAHPFNIVWHQAAGLFILVLLGADPTTLNGFLCLSVMVSVLQHTNARLSLGWLNYVFSTNELHRWHHSTSMQEANSNYGAVLSIWDQLFKTFRYMPQHRPALLGVGGGELYPSDSYLKQLWGPFLPR